METEPACSVERESFSCSYRVHVCTRSLVRTVWNTRVTCGASDRNDEKGLGMTFVTILLMSTVTYLTRIGGYLMLANRQISPRWTSALETASGCVLLCVIAPNFATARLADLLALALTAVAASRLSLLPTVLVGVLSAALLRSWLGF